MPRAVANNALTNAKGIEATNAGLLGQNAGIAGQLQPAYQDLLGGSGPISSATTNAAMGGLGASYDAMTNQAKLTSARTNNSAGVNDLLGQLARSRGAQSGDLAAKTRLGEFEQGASGLSGMYGTNSNLLARSLGIPAEYLNASTNASPKMGVGIGPFQASF